MNTLTIKLKSIKVLCSEFKCYWSVIYYSFPGGLVVKNPPAKQKIQVRSLSQQDPLEKGIATHSITHDWETHRQRTQVDYSPRGHQTVRHDLATKQQRTVLLFFFLLTIYLLGKKTTIICPGVLSTFSLCWWHPHSVFLTSASKLVVRLKNLETCSCSRLRNVGKNTSENGVCLPITSHQEVIMTTF